MTFDDYQHEAAKTAIYPKFPALEVVNMDFNAKTLPLYPFLGLGEEAGEVLGKMKKALRDGADYDTLRATIKAELGDVLWYVANIANEFDIPLEDVAKGNIEKLTSRKERGVLSGSGDTR